MKKLYKKILLAIDGSEDSFRAAERVKGIGTDKTKVVIFNAIEEHFYEKLATIRAAPIMSSAPMGPIMTTTELMASKRAKAQKVLEKAKKLFRGTLVPVELRVINDEEPEDYMLNIIEEEKFDLVVIGCEGEHSTLRRIFLGTIANKLINEAACDVLIVR